MEGDENFSVLEKELVTKSSPESKLNMFINKSVKWLKKDKLNIYLVAVMLFAIAIRLYYFFAVGNQPLWWDELCYGSLAKNLISGNWNGTALISRESFIRPMLFPLVWAVLLFLKLPESIIRFTLEIIPSILSVFFVYLIGKEIYNKKVGIIAAFIFSTLWIHLFYSMRLLTNIPAMLFLFMGVYLFLIAIKKDLNYKYFFLSLFLLSIGTVIRYTSGMFFFLFLFMLFLEKKVYLKNKNFWISGLLGISPILIFFLINLFVYGNIFPALLSGDYVNTAELTSNPIGFHLLNFIFVYLKPLTFAFFLLGISLIIFELSLGYNLISKSKNFRKSLFLVIYLVLFYSFFVFYMRVAEDRWLLESSLALVIFAGYGLDFLYKYIKKYNKEIALIIILSLLVFGAYQQFTVAGPLIKQKQTSYLEMRQAFEWLKTTTPESTVILGSGIEPYAVYYAERNYETVPENESDLIQTISNSDYVLFHAFTPQSELLESYLSQNAQKVELVNAFFFDVQQQQPAVVIYKIKK